MFWKLTQTVVVVFLLAFVAMDLGVPGFCKTDDLPQPGSRAESVQASGPASSFPDHELRGDDCFCCCIHILPEQFWAPYVLLGWTAMTPSSHPSSPDRRQPPFQLPPRS